MASLLSPGNIVQVNLYALQGSQIGETTANFRVQSIGGASVTDIQFATALDTRQFAAFKALMSNNATYRGIAAQIILPIRRLSVNSNANAGAGTAGTASLPTQVRGLLRINTNLSGRAFRGRAFTPFPAGDDTILATGYPSAGFVTRLGTWGLLVFSNIVVTVGADSATLVPVLLHRKANKAGTTTANSTTDTAGLIAVASWATHRSSGELGRPNLPPF